jgi:hypothetical protein
MESHWLLRGFWLLWRSLVAMLVTGNYGKTLVALEGHWLLWKSVVAMESY